MISESSVLSAIVFYTISLSIVVILRKKTGFVALFNPSLLLFISFLGILRLITPFECGLTFIVVSRYLLPVVHRAACYELSGLGVNIGHLCLLVWLIGMLVSFVHDHCVCYRFDRYRHSIIYIDSGNVSAVAERLGIKCPVCVSPGIKQPFTYGCFFPTIYLPAIAFSDCELELILRHEQQHIRSHDNLRKLIFLCVRSVMWWNPIAHIALKDVDALIEMHCDAKVTKFMTEHETLDYMYGLLGIIKRLKYESVDISSYACGMVASVPEIKQRFELIMQRKRVRPVHARVSMYALSIVLFLLSYIPSFRPGPVPQASIELSSPLALTMSDQLSDARDILSTGHRIIK